MSKLAIDNPDVHDEIADALHKRWSCSREEVASRLADVAEVTNEVIEMRQLRAAEGAR
ncbi:MAG: hypothetical protein NVSMB64_13530 [Candidatus Velthaea sp.]